MVPVFVTLSVVVTTIVCLLSLRTLPSENFKLRSRDAIVGELEVPDDSKLCQLWYADFSTEIILGVYASKHTQITVRFKRILYLK